MRFRLPCLLLVTVSGAALAQSDSVTRFKGPVCWRGKPAPLCHTFWLTEISGEYPYATTSTKYPYSYGSFSQHDITPQVFGTVGPMFNTSQNRAVGFTASAGFVNDGSRIAVEGRRRYWSTNGRSAFDLSAGMLRMNVPSRLANQGPGQDGYGLTAGAYAVGGDIINVNARADVLFGVGRVRAGSSIGGGLGSYGAVGATLVFGALVVALGIAIARSGGDF